GGGMGVVGGGGEGGGVDGLGESAERGILHAIALLGDLVPQLDKGAHLADFGDEAHAGIDEERDTTDDLWKLLRRNFAGVLHLIEHGLCRGKREGKLLS